MGLLKLQECQDRSWPRTGREGEGGGGIKTRGESLEKRVLPYGPAWHGQEVKAPTGGDSRVLSVFCLASRRKQH